MEDNGIYDIVLYDFTPEKSIRKGPAMLKGIGQNQNLNEALHVVLYMLKQVSENRYNEWKKRLMISFMNTPNTLK